MDESKKTVFLDEEVAPQLLAIVREAEEHVVIVTPYIKLWRHAVEALALAVGKGVDVKLITRLDEENPKIEQVTLLNTIGVKVLGAPYLHAKIYLNEHAVLVSSMNLTDFSGQNSLEIALVVRDDQARRQVREYVNDTLMRLAVPISESHTGPRQQPASPLTQPDTRTAGGICIRCRRPIYPNPIRPLCQGCYEVWAEYGNENYLEYYCHSCGKPSDVTYARPLCRDCFRRYR
jgi:phosphatidylserine/phosphatidylglycerophosphate/cardiolipin synthase-like enzyme